MAFPTTGVLDNFNRSDVGPPPSASWGAMYSGLIGQFEVYSNQARVDALGYGFAGNYWNPATYTDCEAHAVIATKPTANTVQLWVRTADATGNTPDAYSVVLNAEGGTDIMFINRVDNGVATQLGASFSQEVSNGDSIGIECTGTTISAYYKAAAGSWTSLGSRTDSTYSAAGYLLVLADDAYIVFDDFGGGTIVAAEVSEIAGSSAGTSTTSASLKGTGKLSGASAGVGAAVAALKGTGKLTGLSAGVGSAVAALKGTGTLIGSAAGTSTAEATGSLTLPPSALVGSSSGTSTAIGTLKGTGRLTGASAGIAALEAVLKGIGRLAGVVAGESATSGILKGLGSLTGSSTGISETTGLLKGFGSLTGTSAGVGSVSGTLDQPPGLLTGLSAGTSTAIGVLKGWGALSGSCAGRSTATLYWPSPSASNYRTLLGNIGNLGVREATKRGRVRIGG